MNRTRLIRSAFFGAAAAVLISSTVHAAGPYQFFPITPCRLIDTRGPTGVTGGPAMMANTIRNFPVRNTSGCGIPLTAQAVAFNFTAVQPQADGNFVVYPFGGSVPLTSVLNWTAADFATGNGAIIPLAGSSFDISVFPNMPAGPLSVHLVADVTGYFQ